jgi:hypothetical protein
LKQISVNPKHAVAATAKLRAEVWCQPMRGVTCVPSGTLLSWQLTGVVVPMLSRCYRGAMGQVAADPELKYVAQKAFTSYIRSVSLQPNKDVFDASQLPLDAFAEVRGCMCVCRVPCCVCMFTLSALRSVSLRLCGHQSCPCPGLMRCGFDLGCGRGVDWCSRWVWQTHPR